MPGRARARVRGLRDTCKSSHYRCRIGIIIIVVVVIVLKRNDGRLNAGHNPRNRAGFILKERKAPRTIRERTAGRPTDGAGARTHSKGPFRVFLRACRHRVNTGGIIHRVYDNVVEWFVIYRAVRALFGRAGRKPQTVGTTKRRVKRRYIMRLRDVHAYGRRRTAVIMDRVIKTCATAPVVRATGV